MKLLSDLNKKVIVITGGAGLIGKEFVKAVIENGGIAIIADINEELGKKVKESLSKELDTSNIDFFKLDITSKNSLNECINFLDEKYKKIDALVNNAYPRNKNYGRHFFDVEYEDFIQNLGLNLGGYFTASQQFSKYFRRQGHGNIVNISSIYGVVAPKSYDMNASIYIWKRDIILNENSIFLEKTGLYVMPEERSIDIDNELDFKFVEFLMKEK